MNKRLEHSNDMKTWQVVGAIEGCEFEEKWAKLQQWIAEEQPYGFFRAVDDPRDIEEILAEEVINNKI